MSAVASSTVAKAAAATSVAAAAAAASSSSSLSSPSPLIDIAVNLADCVFVGIDWKGKTVHPSDFDQMMGRALRHGVRKCLVSGTSLVQCARIIRLCRLYPNRLYCTIGVHPANSAEFLVPISDEERRYVVENGGLLRSVSPSHNANDAAAAAAAAGGKSSATNTIPHYTIGGPLKYSTIAEEHKASWDAWRSNAGTNATAKESSAFPAAEERMALLEALIEANRDIVAAVGECGLDGAELEYCPFEVQEVYYKRQLAMAARVKLPLFLHSRDCGMRFVDATKAYFDEEVAAEGKLKGFTPASPLTGVVHSFTGDDEELAAFLGMNAETAKASTSSSAADPSSSDSSSDAATTRYPTNFYIGLNGSAFRTEASAKRSVASIPLGRLMLETDAPWCDIRKDNFGAQFIKTKFTTVKKEKLKQAAIDSSDPPCVERRNEPCAMVNVLECYVGCRQHFSVESGGDMEAGGSAEAIAGQIYQNTVDVFPLLA